MKQAKKVLMVLALFVTTSVTNCLMAQKIDEKRIEKLAGIYVIGTPTSEIAKTSKLLKAATKGDPEAMAVIASCYFQGSNDIEKDHEKAKFWSNKIIEAAEAGNVISQFWVTGRYFNGDQILEKDINKAKEWFGKLEKNGNLSSEEKALVSTIKDEIKEIEKAEAKKKEEEARKKEEELRAQREAEELMKTPQGLSKKIIKIINDDKAPFSEAELLANKLLDLEKSDEQMKALKSVIKECQTMGTGMSGDLMLAFSHEGTQRGRQEIALAAKLQEQMFEKGIGDTNLMIEYAYRCRQNHEIVKAKKYFQKAADEGNVMAMRGLAFCYEDENNMEKAEEWYTKLLDANISEQYYVDAIDFFRKQNRSDKILQVLEISAEKSGNRDAMLRLGDIYRNGHDWEFKNSGIKVAKNLATALKWYKKARETGSKAALFFMADCYWTGGTGLPQNRAQAGKLYKQLMEEAYLVNLNISEAEPEEQSKANYQYGYCLETGTGVVKNIPLAWDLYGKSNEAEAYYRKAMMLEKKWVFPTLRYDLRKQQCRTLYQIAADLGHKQAIQALNRMYK